MACPRRGTHGPDASASPLDLTPLSWASSPGVLRMHCSPNAYRVHRQLVDARAGGARDGVADRWSDGVVGRLAHRLGTERAEHVLGIGEGDLSRRDVDELRDMVVPKGIRGDRALAVAEHLLVERGAVPLRDTTLDLTAQLLGVDHPPCIT